MVGLRSSQRRRRSIWRRELQVIKTRENSSTPHSFTGVDEIPHVATPEQGARIGAGERQITLRSLAAPTAVAFIDDTLMAGGRVLEWID